MIGFKTVGQSPNEDAPKQCRQLLVGPWLNQPEEYEGYNGFVGWVGVNRLRSGRWLLTFSSGSWHESAPWTEEIAKNPNCRKYLEQYRIIEGKRAWPNVRSPRGGRGHVMHSDDQGQTWSEPETLIDTDCDDRQPSILELDDGTLLCTFFTYWLSQSRVGGEHHAKYILSRDKGESWSEPMDVIKGSPLRGSFSNGPAIQLSDGKIIWVISEVSGQWNNPHVIGIYGSNDRGESFERLGVVKSEHHLSEPSVAELPDGRLVLFCRREGDICWSADGGKTWTEPVSIGIELVDPHLLMMPNGVLACFHGYCKTGGLRVVLSPDGGESWHGPQERVGYAVDTSVYGYSHQMVLPDGSIFCVYQSTGGHFAEHARTMGLWGLRLRVHDGADGIDILAAPGSAVAKGQAVSEPKAGDNDGDNLEFGRRS